MEAIKAAVDQFAQRLETSRQHDVGKSSPHEIGGVADGIGPARAGVRNNHRGAGKSEVLLKIGDLLLGRIARHAGRLVAKTAGPHAFEEILAEFHAIRRGAERHFQSRKKRAAVCIQDSGVRHRLTRGGQGQPGGAAQARNAFFWEPIDLWQNRLRALDDTAAFDGNARDRRASRLARDKA